MPLYEYRCPTCDHRFELLRSFSQAGEPATCPSGHAAERLVSMPAARVESGRPLPMAGATTSAGASTGGACCGGGCCN